MKVKIGDKIYDGNDEPVMVILSKKDRENIEQMPDSSTKYCSYPEGMPEEEARSFMKIEDK